ncbi:aspartate phosphatase [Bacillus changyiensis]|uniref:aspartate phosphatase n=1 Tax=Bacillus changyiensis TaxID=3004103 RepID=UPI0022DF9B09|nr:aspartate phosphatase [Bacillus changyiensis]MDA1475862.1 aspartate phosphatase [Bacillus changyiensis]
MEEDQDALLYFQLMDLRHQLMLDYLFPKENDMTLADYLREIEGKGQKFSGLLEYYFSLFSGMYYFSEGKYITAIRYYRMAEKKLTKFSDKIEKAEFYFKIAEVYYHMKQNHMSMYYISLADEIYKKHSTYKVRQIQCHFVIAGNYDDLEAHDKALPHLHKALALSKEIGNSSMITKALLNMGHCYNNVGSFHAVPFYLEAIKAAEKTKAKEITIPYYDLTLIHFSKNENAKGFEYFQKARESAQLFQDDLFMYLLNVVEELFIKQTDQEKVLQYFEPLRDSRGYPYIEELAIIATEFYNKNERLADSVVFYKQLLEAQKQIRRGEFQNEM